MNLIAAGLGLSDRRKELGRQAAVELGAGRLDEWSAGSPDRWVACASDGGRAVASAFRPESAIALYGSGVRTLAGGLGELLGSGGRDLLDGCHDDLVAVLATEDRVVVAGGRGNHRLFHTTLPDGGSIVSSHLGFLARTCGDDLRLDRSLEDFLLGFGFLPDGRTPFQGVRVIEPGTRTPLGTTVSEAVRAPVTDPPGASPPSFDDAVEELHARFNAVVEEQASPDTRHAVLLGGFDSALVGATLRRLGHEVHAFTFGFGDPRYEQRRAEDLARHLGAEHTWVSITPDRVMAALSRFADVFPQPGPQPHYQVHTLLASQQMRELGFTHVFSGDGCDALFLGYPTVNTRARIVQALERTPRPVVRAALAALSSGAADRRLGHVARMGRSVLRNLLLPPPARGHLPTCYLDERALHRLRRGVPPAQVESTSEVRVRLAGDAAHLDRVRLAFHGAGLTGQSRTKVDGAVAATGVVQLAPFLHPSLKSFVASLPTEYLRPPGTRASAPGKALLIEMVRRHELLPDWVTELPKQSPLDSPIDRWYAGPLRGQVDTMLGQLPFAVDQGFIDEVLRPKRAEDLFRDHVSLGHHALQVIGLLCSYAAFTALAST